MFGRKKKSLDDYIPEYNPYNEIEYLKKPKYPEGVASVEHKELEKDLEEYWDLVHPMIADFINSYGKTIDKMAEEFVTMQSTLNSARRNLTLEQENVQELNDQVRELKKTLSQEGVIRRDLEERLRDEREAMENHFAQEKKSLELIAETKFPEGVSIEEVVKQIAANVGSSEEAKRLKEKVKELEEKIKDEREENERIQGELSMSFMEKITKADEIIQTLKERLGE